MSCAGCGLANPAGARFCAGCGASLAPRCPSCGAEGPAAARFCIACGASLAARPADAAAERKVVTILFADLIGSTALHEGLDPESVNRLMDRYYRAVRAPIEAHGGSVVSLMGDGVMCAFGVPRVAEDDAIRAVRAGVEVQRAFRAFAAGEGAVAQRIGLRVAINTGEVVVSDDFAAGIGDPLNVAARLQQEAQDGDVLISGATQRLVAERVTLAPVGQFALKGRSEPVAGFRVVSLERPAGAAAIAFVGREAELARLTAVYDAAVAAPAARLAVVLGSPGLGKSRLLAELGRRLGDRATVLLAQCRAAGGASFAPLAEALRAQLGIEEGSGGDALRAAIDAIVPGEEAERARIAQGIGALLAGTPASPEETFFVVRRLLAALAAQRPVVLAIDDLQWAEPLLFDLTEHLVQWGAGVPLLVLAAARPELRDARSSLATPGGLVSDAVTLTGLDANEATRLAANVIGAEALPAAVAGRVLATSEGNPLFVGELVRMLVQDGALRREGDRWTTTVELADLTMPPTIQALLAARIERLRPEDRLVLERASVVGRQFSRAALTELLPAAARAELGSRLEALRRSELIEPDTGWLLGEPALRFHHVLIRDAAYRRVLKETRAELHERLADWIAGRAGESVEHDETIGWHLEQAHKNLRELGPLDEQARALGERAARRLAAAGQRALARDDLLPAAGLLGRALDRLPAGDPTRADLTLDWCEALLGAGDVAEAAHALAELARLTPDSDRLRAWHTCFSGQLAVLTDPKGLRASEAAVAAAAEVLAAAGDAVGEAKAHTTHAQVLASLGKIGACESALDRALAAARRVNDRRRANVVLAGAPLAALWGPSPVTRASGRCLDVVRVLRITQSAPAVEAVALRCQAVLETLRGRGEAARRMIASSRSLVAELGITQRVLEADSFAGLIELLEGDAPAAERWLRAAFDGLREQGLGIEAANAGALLARALLAQGRVEEAETVSHESEALAGDSFKPAIAWRGVRAEVLAARGEPAAAVELARAAVEIAAATDDLLDHADARSSLAVALRAAGRGAEADAEERRAVELWEAKGATLLTERARRAPKASARAESARIPAAESRRATRPRVERNYATAHCARLDEAVAAGDLQTVARLLADGRLVDHVHGHAYGADTLLDRFRFMIERSAGLAFRQVPIAVLGPSLALARWQETGSGVATDELAVGSYEVGGTVLLEADSEASMTRVESFPADKLGDAIVRLYQRHAELLPEGPERERAAATARSLAAMPLAGPIDVDRWASGFAPDIEMVDPRAVGFGSLRGAEEAMQAVRAFRQLVEDPESHIEDIIGLRPDALLVRWRNTGMLSGGGGPFERVLSLLWVFGAHGLLTRWEQRDVDSEAEALARFDELAAPQPEPRGARRVRANAATAYAARVDSAFAARDADALAGLLSDGYTMLDHSSGVTYERDAESSSQRALLSARDPRQWHEPLATLGDLLALCRMSVTTAGYARGDLDVGAFERLRVNLVEVDAQGCCRRTESFAPQKLGDAVVRLYQRHAELLPESPERARAAATARSVAVMVGAYDPDRFASAWAPSIEYADHRTPGVGSLTGVQATREWLRSLFEVAEGVANVMDDVLCLRSDALLVRNTNSGTLRASRGSYERRFFLLMLFGTDGLVARMELFDAEREAEALARFDALTAGAPAARPTQRRVRANAATAQSARNAAAIAAGDLAALTALVAEDFSYVDHSTGASYGQQEHLESYRRQFRNPDLTRRREILATLGEFLLLARGHWSATGSGSRTFDIGSWEIGRLTIGEIDAQGKLRRSEAFGDDKLGDAIVRLYERHAELLPKGPERERAAATARSAAAFSGAIDLERFAAAVAPDVEYVDRRTLIGLGSARGVAEFRRLLGSLVEAAPDATNRFEDVLDLRPDGWLARMTNSGTDRATGGTYERPFLVLTVFGAAGHATHIEQLDVDSEAEALARFDALTAARPSRIRPNAATENTVRLDAAVRARDTDAFPGMYSDDLEVVDHRTGATFGKDGALTTVRGTLDSRDRIWENEPLATLGESLALFRHRSRSSGVVRGDMDVGPVEDESIRLVEVDERGRRRRIEWFWPRQLQEATGRLYERFAAGLPEGAERGRAETVVRTLAAFTGRIDLDRLATVLSPGLEFADHRPLGFPPSRGADAFLRLLGTLVEAAADVGTSREEILDLRPGALLLRSTSFGTLRDGGGAFERPFLNLWVVGADGLLTHWEIFGLEQRAEALARFDALTAEAPEPRPVARRLRPNAACENAARIVAAVRARDVAAIPAFFSDDFEAVDHLTGAMYGHEGAVATVRMLTDNRDLTYRQDPFATLGDRLALCRNFQSSSGVVRGQMDVGPFEDEKIFVVEVDERGRRRRNEWFHPDRLGDAIARLYARHAELLPEGPERTRAAATASAFASLLQAYGSDRFASAFAPTIEILDHRTLGTFSGHGAKAVREAFDSWLHVATDIATRVDEILALGSRALLLRWTFAGKVRASGGAFERSFIVLLLFGPDGLLARWEPFDLDRDAEALARFDALAAQPAAPRIENAAARAMEQGIQAFNARDWRRIESSLPADFRMLERRKRIQLEMDRAQYLEFTRSTFELGSARVLLEVLATRGERLALGRFLLQTSGGDVGASEIESLQIYELDERGVRKTNVRFDLDDLDAAYAELDARYDAGEAAPHARAWATLRRVYRAVTERDWEQLASALAMDFVVEDHRPIGLLSTLARDEWVASARALVELRPDLTLRLEHVLALDDRRSLQVSRWVGSEAEGAFEIPVVNAVEYGPDGARRWHLYDLSQLDEARARYEALGASVPPDPLRIPPNAATRAVERLEVAFEARDWPALRALAAPEFRFDDRGRRALVDGDVETWIRSMQVVREWPGLRRERRLLATAGERLTLDRIFNATDSGESELLRLVEVAADGRLRSVVRFDPDDRRAAARELLERHAQGEALPAEMLELRRALLEGDLERARAALPPDFAVHDHRRNRLWTIEGRDAWIDWMATLFEQSPDALISPLYYVAIGEHGCLMMGSTTGTLREGGDFKQEFLSLYCFRGGRLAGLEMFEPEDLDRAWARFEEARRGYST